MNESVKPAPWMRDALKQGYIELTRGNLRAATDCCRRVLEAKPDLVEGHFLVGLIALELKQNKMAISAFGSVVNGAVFIYLIKVINSFLLIAITPATDTVLVLMIKLLITKPKN